MNWLDEIVLEPRNRELIKKYPVCEWCWDCVTSIEIMCGCCGKICRICYKCSDKSCWRHGLYTIAGCWNEPNEHLQYMNILVPEVESKVNRELINRFVCKQCTSFDKYTGSICKKCIRKRTTVNKSLSKSGPSRGTLTIPSGDYEFRPRLTKSINLP